MTIDTSVDLDRLVIAAATLHPGVKRYQLFGLIRHAGLMEASDVQIHSAIKRTLAKLRDREITTPATNGQYFARDAEKLDEMWRVRYSEANEIGNGYHKKKQGDDDQAIALAEVLKKRFTCTDDQALLLAEAMMAVTGIEQNQNKS